MNAIDYINTQVWAIQPEWLSLMAQVATRENESIEAVEARLGEKLNNSRTMTVREEIAIIPVTGPIFRYANLFTRLSGATSVQMLALDLQAALDNPNVTSILLNIDSPGGEANGINELAHQIAAAATVKPTKAYIGGLGASGAYWLASAADEVVIDQAAMLGSIGVVMSAMDDKAAYKQKGIDVFVYTSKNAPKKRPKMGTESGDAEIQKTIDALEEVFVESIAANRGVSVEKVLSDFGQGGVLVGKAAVDAGLADRIGSFEALLTEMAGGKSKRKRAAVAASSNSPDMGKDGGKPTMTLQERWDQMKAIFTGDEGTEDGASASAPTTLKAPKAADMVASIELSAAAQEEMTRLKAEVAALQESRREGKAEAFTDSMVSAHKILPAETDAITALYLQCAADDDESPLAEGSRVALIQTMFDKRAAHTISREFGKANLTVVPSVAADKEDEEVKAEKEAAEKFATKANKSKAS